jgi:hypothetical protein
MLAYTPPLLASTRQQENVTVCWGKKKGKVKGILVQAEERRSII